MQAKRFISAANPKILKSAFVKKIEFEPISCTWTNELFNSRFASMTDEQRLAAEKEDRASRVRAIIGGQTKRLSNGCLIWLGSFDKDWRPIRLMHGKQINPRSVVFRIQNPSNDRRAVFNNCLNKKCIAPEHSTFARPSKSSETKLERHIVTETGCYVFPTKKKLNTQTKVRVRGRILSASREAYRRIHGEIPRGWAIKHTCGNRSCFNPRHQRAVPPREERLFREPQISFTNQRCSYTREL